MNASLAHRLAPAVLPLCAVLIAGTVIGCVNVPHGTLLPVYHRPGGFSESYHAALKQREPVLWPVGEVPPTVGTDGPVLIEIAPPRSSDGAFQPQPALQPPLQW